MVIENAEILVTLRNLNSINSTQFHFIKAKYELQKLFVNYTSEMLHLIKKHHL